MQLPSGKIGAARFSGKTGSPLPLLPDGKPVDEFTIFAAGVNDSDYGPVVMDDIAASMLMANQIAKGNEIPFDYNHGMATDGDEPPATAEQGKAAGWFKLAVVDGELRATGIRWTTEAYTRIQSGEYRLFSPWFQTFTAGDGVVRPYRLFNVAILNVAGLNDIDQIAAGAAPTATKESHMTAEEIAQLQSRNRELETENARLRAVDGEVSMISTTLALGPKVGGQERHQAIHGLLQLRSEVRGLTGKDNDAAAVGELHAIKAKAGKVDELTAAAETAQQKALQDRLDNVFKMGAAAGSTAAAPAARKQWEDTTLSAMKRMAGGKLTEDMIGVAEQAVAMAAKVSVPGRSHTAPAGGTTPTGGRVVILGAAPVAAGSGAAAPVAGAGGQMEVTLPPELSNVPGVKPEYLARALVRQQERHAFRTGGQG